MMLVVKQQYYQSLTISSSPSFFSHGPVPGQAISLIVEAPPNVLVPNLMELLG